MIDGVLRHPRKQICPKPWTVSPLCGKCNATAVFSTVIFSKTERSADEAQDLQRENHIGAFFCHQRRGTSMSQILLLMLWTWTWTFHENIPQKHPADGRHFGTRALFLSPWRRRSFTWRGLCVAKFSSSRHSSIVLFFFVQIFFPYDFTHTR